MERRKCELNAVTPITCFIVPIIGQTTLYLTESEIYKCLCSKAEVVEILPNNKRRTLNFSNYNKPYVEEVPVKKEEPKEVVKEERKESETTIPEDRTGFIELESKKEEVEAVTVTDPSPVKTHEVSSRNNNNNKQRKNKNNKRQA